MTNYLEIFIIGLFGSLHCIGMCRGSVSGMITLSVFGLGTIPAMMGLGFPVTRLRPHIKQIL